MFSLLVCQPSVPWRPLWSQRVLAAGHAVQVEQHADAMLLRRLERPVQRVHARDERRVLLGHSVSDRDADRIDAASLQPLEITRP